MKNLLFKMVMVTIAMSFCTTNMEAQSFLKKLKKGAESVLSNKSNAAQQENTDTVSKAELMAPIPNFKSYKVIELDEKGDTIKNEDGTVKYYYRVINEETGEVCDVNTAKKIVNKRLKAYAAVIAKVGGGALLGGATALLSGGDKKDALFGAAAGAAAGLAMSSADIKKIKKLNKELKETKKMLEVYQKTFTEEGSPIEAVTDLSDVEGINFNECEVKVMAHVDVMKDLEKSKGEGESLEEINMDELNS